jgi:cell division protein FtsB
MRKNIFTKQFFLTIILLGLLVFFAMPLIKNWRQKNEIDNEISSLENQVADLEHKNSNIKQVLDYMQSEQFIEHEARTKLNYKKPGEEVAVIENRPGDDTPITSTDSIFNIPDAPKVDQTPKLLGNISKWFDYFFAK